MKLFPRLLLYFTIIIGIQAGLSSFLISIKVERYQEEDLREQVKNASQEATDTFNSWKARLWKALTIIHNHIQNKNSLLSIRELSSIALDAGADILFYQSFAEKTKITLTISDKNLLSSNITEINIYKKEHPFVQILIIDNQPYLFGVINTNSKKIYIIKVIDKSLIQQINNGSQAENLILFGSTISVGNDHTGIIKEIIKKPTAQSYTIYKDIKEKENHWIGVIQLARTAFQIKEGKLFSIPYTIITLVSKKPFLRRLKDLQIGIITATLLCTLLTVLLSLFFSRTIVSPIKQIVQSMYHLKEGRFVIMNTRSKPSKEIQELIAGYNEMAKALEIDKTQREEILRFNTELLNSLEEAVIVITRLPFCNNTRWTITHKNNAFGELFPDLNSAKIPLDLGDFLNLLGYQNTNKFEDILQDDQEQKTIIHRLADGRSIELKIYPLFSGSPGFDGYNRWVLVLEDITSRITYEEKLLQAEKVASVSMLSAGVAHEINNPLTSILTNVQNLISEIKDEEILDLLRLIEQETRRIARIVKELLDFSSSQRNITGGTNIAACVHNVIQLIGYYLTNKKDIHIKVEIPDHLPLLNISEDMFKQILLNIIKNSLEAIVNSGEIEIQAWETNPNNVCIQIKDTGVGIPKEILPRVFDPFFTTKDSGIGMGLSVVYGILQRSGGNISIKSEIKRGTTVILTIPTFRETKE